MGIGAACPRCGSLMLTPSYDDEPMYCIMCGSQGDLPPTSNAHGSKANKTRGSIIYTARYRDGTWDANRTKKLKHLTVRYKLTYADQHGGHGMPALIMACPWCGGVTKAMTWVSHPGGFLHEWYMYVECPSKHSYSMVCNAVGEYYWR